MSDVKHDSLPLKSASHFESSRNVKNRTGGFAANAMCHNVLGGANNAITSSIRGGGSPICAINGDPTISASHLAIFTGVKPNVPTTEPEAHTMIPQMTSRFFQSPTMSGLGQWTANRLVLTLDWQPPGQFSQYSEKRARILLQDQ